MHEDYLSYFTPSQMSHATLEAILVKREELIDRLVTKVVDSTLTEAKHQTLVLGPRGMGKSYVIALTYHRVKARPELVDRLAIAYFAEEEWGIASLTDLFLAILRALDREYGGLASRIQKVFDAGPDQAESAAESLIREFSGDRTLLLLMENLDEILGGLGSEGQWKFRAFLNERPFVTILATSPTLHPDTENQGSAFYGFFRAIYLHELDAAEATELLRRVAELRGDTALSEFLTTSTAMDRVRAVHDLAGGHPRIYLLFAHLLSHKTLDELVTPFLKLLDELTPYYQSRMQLLSPQQRKIVDYLARRMGAVTVKEIAQQNLLSPQTVSSQLTKLEGLAYVRADREGRESYYELREPLLRMVMQLKTGRGEPIRLIVDFLRRWYSRAERETRLAALEANAGLTRRYITAALDLSLAADTPGDPARAAYYRSLFKEKGDDASPQERRHLAAEIIDNAGSLSSASDWTAYGVCCGEAGDLADALKSFDRALDLDPQHFSTWYNRGVCLTFLNQHSQALNSYNRAIEANPLHPLAWYNRGISLFDLGEHRSAIESYDTAINLDPQQAEIWNNRGVCLFEIGEYTQALDSYDRAIEIDSRSASIWYNRGASLSKLGEYTQAVASYDKAIEIDPQNNRFWHNRGNSLSDIGDYELAVKSYSRAIELEPEDASAYFLRSHAKVLASISEDVFADLRKGLAHLESDSLFQTIIQGIVSGIFWTHQGDLIIPLVSTFEEFDRLDDLAQGLARTLSLLMIPEVTLSDAEIWRSKWQAAGAEKPILTVPLRLLNATVEWKRTGKRKALLSLPKEERRILEELLPKEST